MPTATLPPPPPPVAPPSPARPSAAPASFSPSPARAVVPPQNPSVSFGPPLYRWTLDEYYELGKFQVFADKRTELVAGKLYIMALPVEDHNTGVSLTSGFCRRVFGEGHYVREEKGFVVPPDTDVGPDVAVVIGTERDYSTGGIYRGRPTAALLIVEVSNTTLAYDLGTKAELYAKAGVEDYWVLDVIGRRLTVFRRPYADAAREHGYWYASVQAFGESEAVSPLAVASAQIVVVDLLP